MRVVPGTGIEPVRPLCRIAADFKSAVSTNFTTRARFYCQSILWGVALCGWVLDGLLDQSQARGIASRDQDFGSLEKHINA